MQGDALQAFFIATDARLKVAPSPCYIGHAYTQSIFNTSTQNTMYTEDQISEYRAKEMATLQPMFDQLKADGITCEIITHEDDTSFEDDPMLGDDVKEAFQEMVDKHGIWGWCTVEVRLSKQLVPFGEVITGSNYMGGCSYMDQADFMTGGYMPQMLEEAIDSLNDALEDARKELAESGC